MSVGFEHIDLVGEKVRLRPIREGDAPDAFRLFMDDRVLSRLVCHFSFVHLDAARAYAAVFTSNTASRKVLEKNGFSVDGTLRRHVFKRGEWHDEWFLTLLRSEWEVKKERYTPRQENVVVAKGE